MKRDPGQIKSLKWNAVRSAIEFISMILILNYTTIRMESVSDDIINDDFINPKTNKMEVFHSMNAIHLVQKGIVYMLCSIILKSFKKILKSKHKNQAYQYNCKSIHSLTTYDLSNQNSINQSQLTKNTYSKRNDQHQINDNNDRCQSFQLTTNEEIFLGISTFLCIRTFDYFQSVFNVIYLIITKYINFLVIIPTIHFAILYSNRKNGQKLWIKNNFANMLKDTVLGVFVGVGAILAKLLMTEIPSFFRSYSGKSPHQPITLSDILIVILALAMDYILYIGLFWIKQQQYIKKLTSTSSKIITHNNQQEIRKQLETIIFLNSWTKYTVLIFCCYTVVTGELGYLLGFVWRHPTIMVKLVEISLYYFINQCVVCRVLLKYRHHVFISIIMANGMFGKAYFYLFKSFTLMSVPYCLAIIGLFLMIRQNIIELNEQNHKNTYSQQTFSSINKIKQYQCVDIDEKSTDIQQERFDLVVTRGQNAGQQQIS